MNKIKLAIIGAGNMANEYLKVLSNYNNLDLVGIFSRTFSKAENLKNIYIVGKKIY